MGTEGITGNAIQCKRANPLSSATSLQRGLAMSKKDQIDVRERQNKIRVCVAQMCSTNNHAGNIRHLGKAAMYASAQGCQLLALPEVAGLANMDEKSARAQLTPAHQDPYINACQSLAVEHDLWIQTGSTPVLADDGLFLNRSSLVDNHGVVRAHYDKIHLFDIFFSGRPPIKESDRYAPGKKAVLVETPWGPWGLSICYDLRFPHLYRDYAKAGATIQFVPSAFTRKTGAAHWEVLLRARAIENACFIIAPAQVGTHDDGRRTWGHSMVIDPWGEVLLDMGGDDVQMAVVDLDLSRVEGARSQIPSLAHERSYQLERC